MPPTELAVTKYDDNLLEGLLASSPPKRPFDRSALSDALRQWATVWYSEWRDYRETLQLSKTREMARGQRPLAGNISRQLNDLAALVDALELGIAGLPGEATLALWEAAASMLPNLAPTDAKEATLPPRGVLEMQRSIAQLDRLRTAIKAAEAATRVRSRPGDNHRQQQALIRRQAASELLRIWSAHTGKVVKRQNKPDGATRRQSMPTGPSGQFLRLALTPIFGRLTPDQLDFDLRVIRRSGRVSAP